MTTNQPNHTDPHDVDALSFEEAYAQLQALVAQLESGDLPLDEAVTLFERGQVLAQRCGTLLDTAELRVQQITGEDDDPGR